MANVTALAPPPDGRFLVSAGDDQTVRIWSLERLPRVATDVIDDEATRGWMRLLEKTGALEPLLAEVPSYLGSGKSREELLRIVLDRGIPARLRSEDISVHRVPERAPLATIFPSRNGEWIAWTKSGYYAASPEGDRLIGWHMNRGLDRAADWYGADQFASTFYRPKVVAQTLALGSEAGALAALPGSGGKAGLADVVKHAPPTVTITSPPHGTRTRAESIELRFSVDKRNDDPLRELSGLVNGRPLSKLRDLGPVPTDRDGKRISFVNFAQNDHN